ncbi:DUF6286 domain-containing protein [Microtetraspora sp. NBRC 16547]|uniref:DUF6286 domain-containing protein n=1 Tax=Microtetraspora sp. NBRC 16547 TaxID=3030993 RepID=UPI0024A31DA8|nr:DUF6286 domain-containing protein [Microtetraspora sp. NBRC 16547]GLW98680.1 hypothetical protein Misp02_27670 [Microtetraspora sp. NBRC 16547]
MTLQGAQAPEPPASPARASARTRTRAARYFRTRRKVPAAIAAIVLFAVGLLTAVEVISALVGHPALIVPYGPVVEWARTSVWRDGTVMASAGVMGIVGLLLILLGTVAGRPRLVPLRSGDPDMVIGVSRRVLRRLLGAVAGRVDGVRRARAGIRGRRVTIHAGSDLRDTAAVEDHVRAVVEDELAALAPVGRFTVRTKVRGAS